MFIHFDRNRCHMQVVVGSLEEYKPTEKMKELQDKITQLKTQMEEFQAKVIWPQLQEIEKQIAEENEKFSGPKENLVP